MDDLSNITRSSDNLLFDGGEIGFLIVHAVGGTPEECAHLAESLAARGHTVCCPMLVGHGGSQILLGAATWQHWFDGLERAQSWLAGRCRHIVTIGYLTGSLLAIRLSQAGKRPPDALALCQPAIWPPGWEADPLQQLVLSLRLKATANWLRLPEREPYGIGDAAHRSEALSATDQDSAWSAGVFRRNGGATIEIARLAAAVMPDLAKIIHPTLIVVARAAGDGDEALPEKLQIGLGSRVEILSLEESLYRILEDRQRALVAERIGEFAERTDRDFRSNLASGKARELLDPDDF